MSEVVNRADHGAWREIDGGWELRFERRLRHSPERVWRALTTPEGLRCWLAEAIVDARPGGRLALHFRQSDHECLPDRPESRRQENEVLVFQPFSRFEHTFGGNPDSVVTWRLTPDGDGTHLTLVHRIPEGWRDARRNVLSGWHHHMEGLDDAVRGVAHSWDWARWLALRDAYAANIADREERG